MSEKLPEKPKLPPVSVVALDDNLAIRHVLRSYLRKVEQQIGVPLKLYTSEDGVQGVGYIMIAKPDIVIIDSTLPKYSGRELLEFLYTNPSFYPHQKTIVVLHDGRVPLDVPKGYILINKFESRFLEKLLSVVVYGVMAKLGVRVARSDVKYIGLGEQAIHWANRTDLLAHKASLAWRPWKWIIQLGWLVSQVFTSVFLTAIHALIGKFEDDNIEQMQKDERKFRVRHYPTLFAFILSVILILLQLCLFITGGFFLLEVQDRVQTVEAAALEMHVASNTGIVSRSCSGSVGYTTITSIASTNFTVGEKYLVFVWSDLNSSSVTNPYGLRVRAGVSNLAGSATTNNNDSASRYTPYFYVNVWTATNNDLTAQIGCPLTSSGYSARAADTTIVAINAEDLIANGDLHYNYTDTDSSILGGTTSPVSLTFTPENNNDTWWLMGFSQFTNNGTGGHPTIWMNVAGSTRSRFSVSEPFTGDNNTPVHGYGWVQQYSNSEQTVGLSIFDEGGGAGNTWLAGGLFALRLNTFEDFSYDLTAGDQELSAGPDTYNEIATITDTPQTTGEWLIAGGFVSQNDALSGVEGRIELDDTTEIVLEAGQFPYESGDDPIWSGGDVQSYTASTSYTWDLDAKEGIDRTPNPNAKDAWLVGFSTQETPEGAVVSTSGSQTSSVNSSTSNFYVGGKFVIKENGTGSRNVTGITISEHGSVDAQNHLTNIKLFYENDTSAPYDCASESYGGSETQFGSTDTNGFTSANGISTFSGSVGISTTSSMCVYVVLDVTSGASNGQTVDIQIADPSTQVTISAGAVTPDTAVQISGSTTISVSTTVSTLGSQVSTINFNSTEYLGGLFAITNPGGAVNVTGITIQEVGEVDGLLDIDNISLYYDLDTTAPYDCNSVSYSATEPQFGSTDTDGFSGGNGTSSFTGSVSISSTQAMCVYVVLKVESDAPFHKTIDVQITNPSTQVTVSSGSVTPGTPVALSGSTYSGPDTYVKPLRSQDEQMNISSTNQYVGGGYAIISNIGSRNVTSLTLREQGTVDGQNHISNIKLFYESDTSAPYDCSTMAYDGTETQYGTTDTNGFTSANGLATFTGSVGISTTSTMCVYMVLDVTSGASSGQTLEIDISSPSSDVVTSSGDVGPASALGISGTTTLGSVTIPIFRNSEASACTTTGTTCTLTGFKLKNGSSNNRLVVVGVSMEEGGDVTNVTFNGAGMTEIREEDLTSLTVSMWYILDSSLPVSAGDYNIVATTSSVTERLVSVTYYENIDQAAPDGTGGGVDNSPSGPPYIISNSATTLVDNSVIIDFVAQGFEQYDLEPTTGGGTGQVLRLQAFGLSSGMASSNRLITTASSAALGWTTPLTNRYAQVMAAFAPAGQGVTVSTTGSQVSSAQIGSTGQYIGGSFSIKENAGSRNVTGITITEQGTIDGATNLDNIKLFYENDTSAPYDCASESYSGGETQFGATDTTGFTSANGISSFTGSVGISATSTMCVYVVLDVGSGASAGETIEIQISNPSTDVTVSTGSVTPATAVALSGTTTVAGNGIITFGGGGSTTCDSAGTTCTLSNFNISSGSGNNRLVVVGVMMESGGDVTNVTFNGVGMSEIDEADISTNGTVSMWYILDASLPASSGNYDVVATTTNANNRVVGAVYLEGVKQSAPEASAKSVDTAPSSPYQIVTGVTTLTDGAWLVDVVGQGDQNNDFSTTETGQTERWEGISTSTRAAGSTREISTAGSTQSGWSVGWTNRLGHIVAAFAPADDGATVNASGAQTSIVGLGSTNQYLGGKFVISEGGSGRNVTGITITESGSINAQSHMDNIKLFYENDTSAPYDCASESYAGTESQYGATDTNGFSGANGTSSFTGSVGITPTSSMCVYVVSDVTSSASDGNTIEISINNPSSDVTLSSGTASPATVAAISGTTTVRNSATVSATGTHASSSDIPDTNVYVGGTFVITENLNSRNVTSITIREQGTVDASTNLDNIKLFYENDTSAPYDCTSESYAGTESQFGSTDTDGFSSANGLSTFTGSVGISTTSSMCVYVVLDVGAGASEGQTLAIDIANASTDVVVSGTGATVGPASTISINGSMTLGAGWYDLSWLYRKEVTVDEAMVVGTTNFSSFPLLIHITDLDLRDDARNDGFDIVFTQEDGTTELDHEIESFNGATGELWAWIELPTLYATTDTTFLMYYGNSGQATSKEDIPGTWSSVYKAVYHFDETPSSGGTFADSTTNANNATFTDTDGDSNSSLTGQVNGAVQLNGDADEINAGDPANGTLDFGTGDFSLQFWVDTSIAQEDYVISKQGSGPFLQVTVTDDGSPQGRIRTVVNDGSVTRTAYGSTSDLVNDDVWHWVTINYDRDTGITVFVDDSSFLNSTTFTGNMNNSNEFVMGWVDPQFAGGAFPGSLDEVRVLGTLRSADWIYTEHKMMGDNSTYISIGGEDTDTEPPVVSNLVLNGNSDINLTENTTTTIQWTATITDTDGNTDIASADGYLFRSGVATGGTCTPSNNNCYYDSSCALSSCAGNSCTATCSVDVYFHAEPTDAGTYSAQSWQASVTATDDAALTGSGTSSAGVTELLSLIALNVTSSINYGSLTPGANSGATNQSTTVTNTGNVPIDGEISGSAMCIDYPVCAGITIPVGSQEYATSTFTYGAGTDLTGSATIIQLNLAKPTSSPSTSTGTIYWGIGIPSPLETGAYSGQNVLLADQE